MFYQIEIDDWDTAKAFSYRLRKFVYRGQKNALWNLETTIERSLKEHINLSMQNIHSREIKIINEFKRFAHHYYKEIQKKDSILEWLALLQHYGGPTRLLDFTYSFYIAAFFAAEEIYNKDDAAIWAVNLFNLNNKLSANPLFRKRKYKDFDETLKKIKIVSEIINKNKKNNIVVDVEPFILSERISKQQGLFLVSGNEDRSIDWNLLLMFGRNPYVDFNDHIEKVEIKDFDEKRLRESVLIKIVLQPKIYKPAMYDLIRMNITAETLFPGIDGFVRSLKKYTSGLADN